MRTGDQMASTRSSRWLPALARVAVAALLLPSVTGTTAAAADSGVAIGLGHYHTKPLGGLLGPEVEPPAAEYRTGVAATRAAPTNQWYSSVMFQRWSQVIHAHPMTYRATEAGFEIGLPTKHLAVEDNGSKREMRYVHAAALTVSPVAFKPADARLANFSDWLAEISFAGGADALKATVLHGSPFSYYECSRGDLRVRIAGAPRLLWDPRDGTHDKRAAVFAVDGHVYAVFAPTGASFDWSQPNELVVHLPAAARYVSIAGLPDEQDATIRQFLAVAYAFPVDTRTEWSYDEAKSTVRTVFHVETAAKEGDNRKTVMGLYPHQWRSTMPAPTSVYQYDSVRGPIRLITGNEFAVERTFHGVIPLWGGLEDAADKSAVDSLLVGDQAKSDQLFLRLGRGPYWVGKGLSAVAQLMSIAEAEGKTSVRDDFLKQIEKRMESWFDGQHTGYFVQDSRLGTFIGLPQEYNSVRDMNDHHFHYGYWLTAAAHVAMRDPAWAAKDKWGGMIGKIAADIATDERGRSDFPFLRNFDPYEGHSWASGTADSEAGNNQESSSEAVNAWAGLIFYGEVTGDRRMRDLGVFLYSTEVAAVQTYWYDLDHEVITPDFGEPFASMVFGGKYAYNTWWTEEPRQILGINALPITPVSTYLGRDPELVKRLVDTLPAKQKAYYARGITDGTPPDIWQDVIASYLALADADAGRALWNRQGKIEFGETRTHTLFWLSSLHEMGRPDFSLTADTPLYAVFKTANGTRTYLAYNARDTALKVSYSDGTVLDVPAHSLGRSHH